MSPERVCNLYDDDGLRLLKVGLYEEGVLKGSS